MYEFKVVFLFFVLQHATSNAASTFGSFKNHNNLESPQLEDGTNSFREVRNVGREVSRAFYTPPTVTNEQYKATASTSSLPKKKHRWQFGCSHVNAEASDESSHAARATDVGGLDDALTLEVRQGGGSQVQPQPNAQFTQPPPMQQQNQQQQPPQPMMTNQGQFQTPPLQNQQQPSMMPTQAPFQATQGQPQLQQPMSTNQPQFQQPQMQQPQVTGQPQVQAQGQAQFPPQPTHQPPTMAMGVPPNMAWGQPATMAMGQPPFMPSTVGQPAMGFPVQTPQFPVQMPQFGGQMSFPSSPTVGWPATGMTSGFPYSSYPPPGQMPLPIPPNQFSTYGPPTQPQPYSYTNPAYGTQLSPQQNGLEAQIAGTFLSAQMANMLGDPNTREALLLFVSELRGIFSDPRAIPLMRAMTGRVHEIMNTPSLYQQYVPQAAGQPQTTSTIVQVQNGANHLMDKLKAKGDKILNFVEDIAHANNRVLEGTTNDIPMVNSFVKMGTGLTNAGLGFLGGIVRPLLQSNSGGTTTVTTVSTPPPMQSFPNTQYQQSLPVTG